MNRPASLQDSADLSPSSGRSHHTAAGAIVRGSVGFAMVSLGGFAVWAFGGRWFETRIGEPGMYAVSALVFLVLSGLILHPLIHGPRRTTRFYKAFLPAFVAYAIVWSVAWFAMGFGFGEWIGSLLGTLIFAALIAWSLGSFRSFVAVALVLFVTHSLGYFLGGELYYWLNKPAAAELFSGLTRSQRIISARMLWGLLYGLGFGAGIGYAFFKFQTIKHPVQM